MPPVFTMKAAAAGAPKARSNGLSQLIGPPSGDMPVLQKRPFKGGIFMSKLPKDPMMLYSYINTQLRDNYASLKELCSALDAEEGEIITVLEGAGFSYDPERNCFR